MPCVQHIQDAWIPEEPDWPGNSTFSFIFDHVDSEKLEPYVIQVFLPIIVGISGVLFWLVPYWFVSLRATMHFQPANEENATHVACFPKKHHGLPSIEPIRRENGRPPYILFQFKKRTLVNGEWVVQQYPNNLKISEYLANKGLTDDEAAERLLTFGTNAYSVPIPGFIELMTEHIRSPMFVFQAFCCLLFLLDEYWLYPFMSLGSLLFTEATTVKTRQRNLLELRGVETPPTTVFVKRQGSWKKITSDMLVPGDVVLLDKEGLCPCDMLVIRGRAVVNEAMLTGESTPQVKESAATIPGSTQLNVLEKHKNFVLFAGTTIEQLLPDGDCAGLPERGVVCQVLATGLGSTQGKLIRTIIGCGNTIVQNNDAFLLLLFLSVFAFITAGYVWHEGKKSGGVSTYRLVLKTVIIMVSTLPADLPLQLNFSVNTSMIGLSRLKVFCTEPYRVPYAGMITCCCFDKTGTLTAEEYRLIGVDDMNNPPPSSKLAEVNGTYYTDEKAMPIWALRVIGGCHSLVRGSYGQLVGDSLEATGFSSMRFKLAADGTAEHARGNITPIKSFPFASELMRMTVICSISGEDSPYALMKGAPEAVAELLESVPSGYHETNMKYTRQGCRVLAMAYREISASDAHDLNLEREKVEQRMKFAGFVIFSAAMKRGSEDTIVELLKSSHRCIIITGDNPLTACHVAKLLHMTTKKPAIHDVTITDDNGNELKNDDGYELCYTGRALTQASEEEFEYAVQHCNIFARMSPNLKARVVTKLQSLGHRVLMCGDGTNDVNALKQAGIGMGIVNDDGSEVVNLEEDFHPQLGAASIAAPVVSKRGTVSAVIDVIRFGRSTLSGTLDLFKQIALNSLISAYTLSVLEKENVRFGEIQMNVISAVMMIAAFSIAWVVPRRTVSKERPLPGQFNAYLVCSVLLQFGIHMFFLYLTHKLVFASGFQFDRYNARARFSPSLLNTAIFIMKSEMELLTIWVNYRGAPFMQSFLENKTLMFSVVAACLVITILLLDVHPLIRKACQLVEFPSRQFQATLALYCLLDAVLTVLAEFVCVKVFSGINKKQYEGLVSDDVIDALDDYISNDDDVLPEERHQFGMADLLMQNAEMQKIIAEKSRAHAAADRKKRDAARKAREEAEQFTHRSKK